MDVDKQLELLSRGAAEIISVEDLRQKLKSGRSLKIKLGLDPTAPHIHLGFAVVLRKLRQFQDLGHTVQLLIGDFTARVGDPTGVSDTRKVLTPEEIESNARTYREQFTKILDPDKTVVEFNSKWLGPMTFEDILKLTARYTVAQILQRDDFEKRYKGNRPIGVHEFMYPLMQGYDSVALASDVELGGTDQKFNNLVGRELQRQYGMEAQVVFLMPILEGLDGVEKMSKSKGNYVGISEPPNEMFGKLMSIPDGLMPRYYELCTEVPRDEYERVLAGHPMDAKQRLGREIVTIYHGADAAKEAQDEFERVHSRGEAPTEMKTLETPPSLRAQKLAQLMGFSGREARRLSEQGAVSLDGEKLRVPDAEVNLKSGMVLKVGTLGYARIKVVQNG
ncbi:MAG: tyrosine--tRNA ligase [Candidatus Xenobia bacterium]